MLKANPIDRVLLELEVSASSELANYDHGRILEVLKVASDKRVLPIDIPRLVEAAANSPDVNAKLLFGES